MRILGVVLAVAISVTSRADADTYPRQPGVDALHYRFSIAVSDASAHIDAEAVTTFKLLQPVKAIELDLVGRGSFEAASGQPPNDTAATGMAVRQVVQSGKPVTFVHSGNRLRLPVPDGVKPGDEVSYTITYAGTPAEGLKVYTNIHGDRVMFSEGWPNRARHWLPVIDHPYDKATGEMIVTAPAQWQVVSNGVLVEEVDLDGERRRTHWKQNVPIASWLFAVGIARFSAHHAGHMRQVPIQTWSFPQDSASARTLFEETTRRAIEFFSDRIGPYPYEKLANVQASGFGGGMENATVIFYGEKGVSSGRGPVVHEVAHQWFGNSVTERDWDDVWLSEGFATYFASLYREHYEGRDAFVEGMQRSRATVLKLGDTMPDTPIIHRNLDDMERVLNGLVYEKGGWVLHMLRGEVGTETFWRGISEYYRRYRDVNASTDDFRQVMEGVAGRDLGWFFRQWLQRGGNPVVEGTWRYDAAKQQIQLMLKQTQPGDPYILPIDVGIAIGDDIEVRRIRLESASSTFSIPAKAAPRSVSLDPDTWLLARVNVTESR